MCTSGGVEDHILSQSLDSETKLLSGSTQQFQGLDVVGNYVTDSGNNLQTSILACAKVSFKNLTKSLGLVLPW